MKKIAVEFIGTFFLMFTIGMTVFKTPEGVVPPLAIGAVLMAMIFAGGHISGAHYNPAVTLAVFIRRKIALGQAIGYIIAQTVALRHSSSPCSPQSSFSPLHSPG